MVPTLDPFTFHWYDGLIPGFVAVAVKVTLVAEQIVVALALMLSVGVWAALTFTVIPFEVAVLFDKQLALDVSTQVTVCPFVSALVVNVALLVPVFTPLIFHWYTGEAPALVVVAVNTTCVPAQNVVCEALILMVGRVGLFTTTVIAFEVAGLFPTPARLEVITQVTTCPLVKLLVV